tara:strand:- start:186 stop:668 length:483 start_codon:yes stop_codon:yes gene_type:complete
MRLSFGAAPNLSEDRARAAATIDAAVGALRARFLTDIPGQSDAYTEKLADCRAFIAATDPALDDYPWVKGEALAQNMTPEAAAQFVIDTYNSWRAIGVAIELIRLTTKRLIAEAGTANQVAMELTMGNLALKGEDTPRVPAEVTAIIRQALYGDDLEEVI